MKYKKPNMNYKAIAEAALSGEMSAVCTAEKAIEFVFSGDDMIVSDFTAEELAEVLKSCY